MAKISRKLAACLLNISEARNAKFVEEIARAAIVTNVDAGFVPFPNQSHQQECKCQSTVLNIFSDPIYNRSVITIAGEL